MTESEHAPNNDPDAAEPRTDQAGSTQPNANDSTDDFSAMPYPGLRPFTRAEADIFFGRDQQIDGLLNKLEQRRFLAVVGSSGSGKSSLVRAGLASALDAGFMATAGYQWITATMKPGNAPIENLALCLLDSKIASEVWSLYPDATPSVSAILRRGPRGLLEFCAESDPDRRHNLLIVVDQFEELFRFHEHGDKDESISFVNLLLAATQQTEQPIYVVATMRSDFLGHCAMFAGLPEAINEGQFLVPRLSRQQCREAIIGPAAAFGATVEEGLVNRILNDMRGQSDELPLMQHALMLMWLRAIETCQDTAQQITLSDRDYDQVGGINGALFDHLESVFSELSEREQAITKLVFCGLTERNVNQQDTRRPASVLELANIAGVDVSSAIDLIDRFRQPARNFLMPPSHVDLKESTVIDISHESLIRRWDRLQNWVAAEADSARLYRRLRETAELWSVGKAALWGTPDLELGLAWRDTASPNKHWARRYGGGFEQSMRFLAASESNELQRQRENLEQSRRKSRTVFWTTLLSILTPLLITAIAVTSWSAIQAYKAFRAESTERVRADANAAEANREEQRALQEKARADAEAKRARDALSAANVVRAAKQKAETSFRARSNYFMALTRWNEHRANAALEFLESVPPHLREFEWNLAYNQFQGSDVSFFGHTESVRSLVISPDGATVVSAGKDGIRLWDISTGKQLPRLLRGRVSINSLAIDPNGSKVVAACDDGTIKVWELEKEKPPVSLAGHRGNVWCVDVSPDGRFIASGGKDQTVRLWDLQSGVDLGRFETLHEDAVRAIRFSPSGQRVVSGGRDKTIRVWDVKSGSLLSSQSHHSSGIHCVQFSPDESVVAAASPDGRVSISDVANGELLNRFDAHKDGVSALCFTPDGSRLVTGGHDHTLKLWDGRDFRLLQPMAGHTGMITSVCVTPDAQCVVSTGSDQTIKLWNVSSADVPITESRIGPRTVGFSPDGAQLVTAGGDRIVRVWDVGTKRIVRRLTGHRDAVLTAAYNPRGNQIASGSKDKTLRLWDLMTDKAKALRGHRHHVMCLAYRSDGQQLVSGDDAGNVIIWDANNGEQLGTLDGHEGGVLSVAYSSNGARIVTGGRDKLVRVWNATSFELIHAIKDDPEGIRSVQFSEDGERLIVGRIDNDIRIYDAKSWERILTLGGHVEAVWSVALLPKGQRMVSGSRDNAIKLWESETGTELRTIKAHSTGVDCVAFSPTGDRLASVARDRRLNIWQAPWKPELHRLKHDDVVAICSISEDAKSLRTSDVKGTSYQWDIVTGALTSKNASTPDTVANDATSRIESGRWLAIPRANYVLLIDQEFKDQPLELSRRGTIVEPNPVWHANQAKAAARRSDWFARTFHLAWLASIDPERSGVMLRLKDSHARLREGYAGQVERLETMLSPTVRKVLNQIEE